MNAGKPRWDIFCKIVDNFGDIGVCWRLARQLENEHALQVRLWVDNLAIAQKIIPIININKQSQIIDNIEICVLKIDQNFADAADVVIETFSCGLPENYLHAMSKKQSKWVNLEYLSAESWVDDFHAKPSPQPHLNLTRHFYFPGFTQKTGGLIRERDVAALSYLSGGATKHLTRLTNDINQVIANPASGREALKISLFCYPNAPINDLFDALRANIHAVCVHVPESIIWPKIAEYFGKKIVQAGEILSKNNLSVQFLPFLSQAEYDQLLRDCDLNFVRGEDSWLRAIWAGKPFIWQPYVQDDDAHIAKLNAFLDVFYVNLNIKDMPCKAHGYWAAGLPSNVLVGGHVPKDVFHDYLAHLPAIKIYTLQQSQLLAKQQDLASKLVDFCNNL
jgi:uncharacterized repeat protein (TIGR03837 family)